jgi:hypothetical protein
MLLTQFGAQQLPTLGDTNPGRKFTIVILVSSPKQTPSLQLVS